MLLNTLYIIYYNLLLLLLVIIAAKITSCPLCLAISWSNRTLQGGMDVSTAWLYPEISVTLGPKKCNQGNRQAAPKCHDSFKHIYQCYWFSQVFGHGAYEAWEIFAILLKVSLMIHVGSWLTYFLVAT